MSVVAAQRPGTEPPARPHAITRARALVPVVEAAAARIEAARELPTDLLETLHEAAIFRTLLPRSLGGDELHPAEFVQVTEAIAMGDGSVGWVLGQGSGCSMTAGYLAPAVAREVFGGRADVLAWGYGPNGRAIECAGGYRVTGKWSFASGSRHATWIGGHCIVCTPEGTPRRRDENRLERTMLFRRDRARFIDDWQVMGLRGTGSDSYAVEDLFVPSAFSAERDVPEERTERGTLYRFSSRSMYAGAFAGVALGLARAMLDAFIELAQRKTPTAAALSLRDNPVIQLQLGYNEGRWRAARASLHQVFHEVYDKVEQSGTELNVEQRVLIRMASTFAIHQAREVAEWVWQEAGATAIFEKNPFERRFRDIHAVTQQAQGKSSHFETVGQHFLGLRAQGRFL